MSDNPLDLLAKTALATSNTLRNKNTKWTKSVVSSIPTSIAPKRARLQTEQDVDIYTLAESILKLSPDVLSRDFWVTYQDVRIPIQVQFASTGPDTPPYVSISLLSTMMDPCYKASFYMYDATKEFHIDTIMYNMDIKDCKEVHVIKDTKGSYGSYFLDFSELLAWNLGASCVTLKDKSYVIADHGCLFNLAAHKILTSEQSTTWYESHGYLPQLEMLADESTQRYSPIRFRKDVLDQRKRALRAIKGSASSLFKERNLISAYKTAIRKLESAEQDDTGNYHDLCDHIEALQKLCITTLENYYVKSKRTPLYPTTHRFIKYKMSVQDLAASMKAPTYNATPVSVSIPYTIEYKGTVLKGRLRTQKSSAVNSIEFIVFSDHLKAEDYTDIRADPPYKNYCYWVTFNKKTNTLELDSIMYKAQLSECTEIVQLSRKLELLTGKGGYGSHLLALTEDLARALETPYIKLDDASYKYNNGCKFWFGLHKVITEPSHMSWYESKGYLPQKKDSDAPTDTFKEILIKRRELLEAPRDTTKGLSYQQKGIELYNAVSSAVSLDEKKAACAALEGFQDRIWALLEERHLVARYYLKPIK